MSYKKMFGESTKYMLYPVESSLKGVTVNFSDFSDAVPLSNAERQALSDAKRGKTNLTPSQQKSLAQKAKKAQADLKAKAAKKQREAELIRKAKQTEKQAKEKAKMDKRTGTKPAKKGFWS